MPDCIRCDEYARADELNHGLCFDCEEADDARLAVHRRLDCLAANLAVVGGLTRAWCLGVAYVVGGTRMSEWIPNTDGKAAS